MITRLLKLEEWPRLKPILAEFSEGQIPTPTTSNIVICEEEGEILGIACLQLITHLEPVWIRADRRGKGVLQRMLSHIKKSWPKLNNVVSTTSQPKVAQLMRLNGMDHLSDLEVFIWRLKQ